MFGPDDPSYTARDQACRFVGRAVGHVVCGTDADLQLAKRAISRAIKIYMATGLTRGQAVAKVISFAEMLGSLE